MSLRHRSDLFPEFDALISPCFALAPFDFDPSHFLNYLIPLDRTLLLIIITFIQICAAVSHVTVLTLPIGEKGHDHVTVTWFVLLNYPSINVILVLNQGSSHFIQLPHCTPAIGSKNDHDSMHT